MDCLGKPQVKTGVAADQIAGNLSVPPLTCGRPVSVEINHAVTKVALNDDRCPVSLEAESHQMIEQLADARAVVVAISSHLPEILSLSDRILVARQSRIVEEMTIDEASEEKMMHAAVH